MLYKFQSKATGDLIMLEPQGRRILEIIGKTPGSQGIIELEHMRQAIESLREAIVQEEKMLAQQQEQARSTHAPGDQGDKWDDGFDEAAQGQKISLRQRATPFIEMLERCLKEKQVLVWGA